MKIDIHNPSNLPVMDYRKWKPLQGDLKDLTKSNYAKLKNVLIKRGYTAPAILWQNPKDGEYYIIDAHQRQRVMLKEDMKPYEVPYVLIEAKDEKDAKAQLLEITSQYGTITQDGYDTFTAELPEMELQDINFDALTFVGQEEEADTEEDEAPEVDESEPPRSKLGEIYQLGRHRVMCGDSTVKANVELLMDGEKADMVFTDPPYGMFLDTAMSARQFKKDNWISKPKNYDKVIGDNDDFTPERITTIFDNFGYVKEMFVFGADYFAELLPERNRGSWIVWDKRAGVETMQWSTSEFELCWSKARHQRKAARITWSGILGTEQEHDHADGRAHPTQKPTRLANWFFNNWGRGLSNVVDIYLGSGSTLIACEQTNRVCYGLELDERYVDVIRKRYVKFVNDGELPDNWEEMTPSIKEKTSNG